MKERYYVSLESEVVAEFRVRCIRDGSKETLSLALNRLLTEEMKGVVRADKVTAFEAVEDGSTPSPPAKKERLKPKANTIPSALNTKEEVAKKLGEVEKSFTRVHRVGCSCLMCKTHG